MALLLILLGLAGVCVWSATLLETRWVEISTRWRLEGPPAIVAGLPWFDRAPADSAVVASLDRGAFVARLSIPRLGVEAVVLEGVDPGVLRKAVGHFPASALPGEPGNAAFAGHRDTFFRALEEIRPGDQISISPADGEHLYEVTETLVVEPTAVEVLVDRGLPEATLVTCYPFRFVGPAPQRFIVRARLVSADDATGEAHRTPRPSTPRPERRLG